MRVLPSPADWIFLAILAITLLGAAGPSALLDDGDVGWHIRTGDWILAQGAVPHRDLFSFSRPGGDWYAWEWLADALFAVLHRVWGLNGVAALAGLLIALPAWTLYRRMLAEGAGLVASLAVVLLVVGAASVHSLARPHLFTYALLPVAAWMLERDRMAPSRAVWWLVPLTALWTNLHAGFAAWLVLLGLEAAAALLTSRTRAIRLGVLLASCAAATLANPYGWELHRHIAQYLNSAWIRDAVEEFQAPRFRNEASLHFLLLLFAALMVVPRLWRDRRHGAAATLVFWAQAALHSARHMPVFAVVAAPLIPVLWRRDDAGAPASTPRSNYAAIAVGAALIIVCMPAARFREVRFPCALVESHRTLVAGRRVLTSDQWADYLLYRLPGQKVLLDGRTDYYGPELAREYSTLMLLSPGWERALAKWNFDAALLPNDWPLVSVLRRDPVWQFVCATPKATLLVRAPAAVIAVATPGPNPRASSAGTR